MSKNNHLTFVVAVNDENVLAQNLIASPFFRLPNTDQIILQRGFSSAACAYNDAINKSNNDLMVFLHQDILLPSDWKLDLFKAIDWLEKEDPSWGVLGCYGTNKLGKGSGVLYCSANRRFLGNFSEHPTPVQTLDEIILIFRKSTHIRFDNNLPYFHLYGLDICMTALSFGRNCYSISAFCIHNANGYPFLPKEFFKCYQYIKRKWRKYLPINHTCIKISKNDFFSYLKHKYIYKIKYYLFCHLLKRKFKIHKRIINPTLYLEGFLKRYYMKNN